MRVLATADPLGGVFTYAVELARALGPYGIETHLATMGGPLTDSQRTVVRSIPSLTVHESTFRLEWMDDPWDDLEHAGHWLSELVRRLEPDLVHLNTYAHATLDFGVPKLVSAHSCVGSWWKAVHGVEAPPRYGRYLGLVREGLQAADLVVAPTAAFLREMTTRYGPLRDARVVHNGISPIEPGSPDREPVVLAAGRLWDEAKNLSVLDQVADGLPWAVQLAGEVHHPDGREFSARHATLLGPLPRSALVRAMRRASILCHPARYEPFGLVPLEAAAAGCALVLGDLPTLREIWGDAAWYVPPDDPAAIRSALQRLIDWPVLRERLSIAARRQAQAYGVEATARSTLVLYAELASSNPSSQLLEAR